VNLNHHLPDGIARKLEERVGSLEGPNYVVPGDLASDGRYGERWLVVAGGQVAVCDDHGPLTTLRLAEIKEVKVDELFGGARLVAKTGSGERNLITYTKACVPEFAAMCRVVNDLIAGRTPEVPEEDVHAYCPKCRRPLPERGEHCVHCVRRLEILRRLVGLLRPYRFRTAMLLAVTFATVGSQMLPPLITKAIVDEVIRKKDLSKLIWWIGGMLGCGAVLLVARVISGWMSAWLAARVVADLRSQLHAHLQNLRMHYFNRRDSGELVARVMNDSMELQQFLIEGLPFLLVNTISFVAIAVILLSLDARLAVLVFLPVPFLLGGGGWFWRKLIPMFHKHGTRMARLHTILGESIRGIKTVKAVTQETRRSREFNVANESLGGIQVAIDKTFRGFFEVMFWIMSLGVAAVWFFAAKRLSASESGLSLGDLLAFVGYIWLFYGPLQWFTAVLNWMTHAFAGAERIFAVLDSPSEMSDSEDAVERPRIRGAIAFSDVRFSYERGKEVIKGMSFEIAAGEMVGLVGKSGAGKSTIINLVSRFYDPDSGQISVDGFPIRKIKLRQLRGQIGMVMQEPFLFNATILENIRYGRPDATFDEVVRAARAARAHEFILAKEDGYDTYIGEGGAALSGGEKQRIAIAQAILHDPPILILDEATSSVDSETEKAIQEAIANLTRNRTTIAIAHRLATLRNANRLMVIEDGQLIELGTHDELVAKDGVYAKLVKIQTDLNRLKAQVWQE
jgi:ATP-binding cassette subfamily B protein